MTQLCPIGVNFDGSSYCATADHLTGIVAGSQGTMAFWIRMGTSGDGKTIFSDTAGIISLNRRSQNDLRLQIIGPGGELLQATTTTTSLTADGNWHSVLISWDTGFSAGNKLVNIYIDNVQQSLSTVDADAAFDIDYVSMEPVAVGAASGGAGSALLRLIGDLTDFWFHPTYIDFTVAENRQLFVTAGGRAADVGNQGTVPTGSAPILFLRGPAADFPTNVGTGGDFTVTGALTGSADHPPCAVISPQPPYSGSAGIGISSNRRRE